MVDIADTANDTADQRLIRALETRTKFDTPSVSQCENCGNDIPTERQKLGSVKYCIECQSALENNLKHYRY